MTEGAIRDAGERLRRGDPHGALSLIREARELGASDPGLDILEAGAALEAGRPRDAYRLLTPATGSPDPRIRARATWWLGRLLAAQGDAETARQRVAEALELDGGLATDEALRAEVDLAELDGRLGDGGVVARMLAVARTLDEGGDPFGAAQVLVRVADVHLGRREPGEAERWLVAAEDRAGRSDEPGLLVPVWERLAEVALRLREPARALLLARRALARSPADDTVVRARLWALVGRAHALHGDLEGAGGAHRRSAEIAERSGASGVAARLDEAAALLALGRRAEGAARLAALAPFTRHDAADAVLAALTLVAEDVSGPAYAGLIRRITRWSDSASGRSARLLDAVDRAAERSTDRIRGGAGGGRELGRAVRLRGMALGLAGALGEGAEAVRQGRALQNLGGLGAPVPAGPFDLTRKLGWGAVGDVWRGRHHEHRVGVAVKVLSRRHDSPRMAQLFLTEVRAMAVLDHPNIVRVLGTGTLGPEAEAVSHGQLRGGHPWFAMELAEGGTLETVRGRLPWSGVRAVLTSLLDALAHAHARGVVHLDLKCSNALLRREEGRPTVVLSDFGLAKLVHTDTARGAVAGTPTTMSPEQFRGDARDLGPWTDLYALGAVAVELLTGRPVFDVGDSLEAQREAHLDVEWAGLPPEVVVPVGFEAWIRQLLAKDPAERFQRAADASHALASVPDVPDHPVSPALEPFRPRAFTLSRHTLEEDTVPPADRGPVGAERPAAPHRPPVPADWRPLVERAPGQDFVDVAPTLFGLARVPFVGREVERDLLWRLLRAVAAGGGPRFVAICGRPGTGRTALARWLGERAHELGVATVLDATGGVDGLPGLRALVERHLRLGGLDVGEAASRAARALPGLQPWVAEDLAALVVEHGLAQPLVDRVGSVAAMIALLATGRPVVLRMARSDDDDPAERVLRRLLLDAGTPVMCVVEAADAEDDELELRLGGLDLEGSEALLDALLPLATPVRRAVARTAAGHPELLVAIVGDLLSRDALQRASTAWELRPGETVELPERILADWTPRVTAAVLAAEAPARTALAAMALLGDRLDAARAHSASEAAGTEVRAVLQAFRDLVRSDGGAPVFVHPAVRAIVVDAFVDLLAAEAAAAAVEQHPDGCEVLHAQLLVRAGRMFEAPPWLLVAARRWLDDGDPEQALAALDRRAEILRGLGRDPSGAEQVPDALLRARVAHEKRSEDARTLLAIGCALAERHEAWGPLGEARLCRAEAAEADGDPAAARQELRLAADAFAAAGDIVGTARAMAQAGRVALRFGDLSTARSLLERALARLVGPASGERAQVYTSLAQVARAEGDDASAARHLAAAAAHAPLAPGAVRAELHAAAAAVARDRGDAVTAEAELRQALALVPWHDVGRVRELQLARAQAALAGGRVGEARRLLDGLPTSPVTLASTLVVSTRADEAAWQAAWDAAVGAADPGDRDVAWLFDLAGQRAAADGRADRAGAAFAQAAAAYDRLGLGALAAAVSRKAETLHRARG